MERYEPNIKEGLTKEQVEKRIQENLVNIDHQPKTKSIKEIITSNFFNYFNFLNIALGSAVFIAGILNGEFLQGLKNCLFMGVIIINSIISIIEEIISKRIIDRLSVLSETKVKAIRNKEEVTLGIEELVLDDIIVLSTGHQIVADAILLDGEIEVNESLITGEADAISKKKGDMLLSGSFVVSGSAHARVEHVGEENYVSQISKEAKYEKKVNSIIMNSFETLLKILSILIVPISVIMFISQYHVTESITEAIFTTVASLIGMIPEGLVLLTSSVMAVSVIRLSKYKVLVQQLYCIETLARVDVICLDKTGTLTEGKMKVHEIIPYKKHTQEEMQEFLSLYARNIQDESPTMKAIKEKFKSIVEDKVTSTLPFSSSRKFAGMSFKNHDSIYIGAPEFLLKDKFKSIESEISSYQEDYRVLCIATSKEKIKKEPESLEMIGFIIIEDIIRPEAKDTLDYFKSQGVSVKIISGDNVSTVLSIAKRVGLKDMKGIDVSNMDDEELRVCALKYQVFGRVSPTQKKVIVEALQNDGRVVAMTGDGVNDVLALKKSDCAISVASGSDAARNVAQLVLLDDNFDSMPHIVAEGRRTINNIERSASLLLVKTIYTVILILFSVFTLEKYVFIPIQLTLITTFTIGTPSFILALEPNNDLVKGNFLLKVVSKALPTAMTVVFNVILVTCFANVFDLTYEMKSTISVFLTTVTGLIYLYKICKPFTWLRGTLFFTMLFGFIYCLLFQNEFFNLLPISSISILIGFVLVIDSLYIYRRLNYIISKIFNKLDSTIEIEY